MAVTPEGKVKAKISKVLDWYGAYRFMPVQNGMGTPGLDYHCAVKGFAFFIEAKAPRKKPTARQNILIDNLRVDHGCTVFVIDDTTPAKLWPLIKFLDDMVYPRNNQHLRCIAECWNSKELDVFINIEKEAIQ